MIRSFDSIKKNQTGADWDPGIKSTNGAKEHFSISILKQKSFPWYGWYKGRIHHINVHATVGKV